MKKINEEILEAWLQLTHTINNEKIVSQYPFNETMICRILYQNLDKEITATDLCAITEMQKSQMNRTLISMESKNIISRQRSKEDKRKIFIELNKDQYKIYQEEHQRILHIVDVMVDKLGDENSQKVLDLFNLITHIAKEEIE